MFPCQCNSISFSWLLNVIAFADWVRRIRRSDALRRFEKQREGSAFFHSLIVFYYTRRYFTYTCIKFMSFDLCKYFSFNILYPSVSM